MDIWWCFNIVLGIFLYLFRPCGPLGGGVGVAGGSWYGALAAGPWPGARDFGQKSKIFEIFQKLYFGRKWVVMDIWWCFNIVLGLFLYFFARVGHWVVGLGSPGGSWYGA